MSQRADVILKSLDNYLVRLDDFQLHKMIGQGAYGEVWLADHIPTGVKCAVKKLLLEELEGQHLTYFCREVMILARCRDFFLLPFLGFTSTPPYTIVTQFVSRGSLYDALQHKEGSPNLTATNKTLIAIGIAHGMMALHKDKIIHRDLKSLNILLDDDLYPKICDFGVARYMGEESAQVTQQIGTTHWMAPEMFSTTDYTEKVDVYAYAILLWELLTEKIPYAGMNGVQIAMAVCNDNARPAIPNGTPAALSQLIMSCWHRDPEKRPSFKQVLKYIFEKSVLFEGTDPEAVKNMHLFINQKKVPKMPAVQLNPLPEPKKVAPVIQPAQSTLAAALKDTKSPTFVDDLNRAFNSVPLEGAAVLYTAIAQHMTPVFYEPLSLHLISLFERNPRFVDTFVSMRMHELLPLNKPSLIPEVVKILSYCAVDYPNAITEDISTSLLKQMPQFTKHIVHLFSRLARSHQKVTNQSVTFKPYMSNYARFYEEGHGREFNSILDFLISNSPQFSIAFQNSLTDIFSDGLRTFMYPVVESTYTLITKYPSFGGSIIPEIFAAHLETEEFCNLALNYLCTCNFITPRAALIDQLIECLRDKPLAVLVLCRICENPEGAYLVARAEGWMGGKYSLQLLLAVSNSVPARKILVERNELIRTLQDIIAIRTQENLISVSCLILALFKTAEIISRLDDDSFMEGYIRVLMIDKEVSLARACVSMVNGLGRISYLDGFKVFIAFLPSLLRTELALDSLSTMVVLSVYPEGLREMRETKLTEILKGTEVPDTYVTFKDDMIKRLEE